MLLLNRYLLLQFLKNFITVALGFIAIYLLIDFFDKIDHFTTAGKPFTEAVKFSMLNVPFILDQLGPVLILLSGVITLGILNHNHELNALKASGIPLRTIVKPILAAGIGITLMYMAMAQWVLPLTMTAADKIWYQDVQGKVPLGTHRNGRYYYKGSEGFYSFQWREQGKYIFRNFSYSAWDKDFHLGTLITCAKAEYNKQGWQLFDGQIQKRVNGKYEIELFTKRGTTLPESPEIFFIPQFKPEEMSLTELYRDISKKDLGSDQTRSWVQFTSRVSYILLGLPLLVLGLPIVILSYRQWGRDLAIAIPASCGIAFIAWGFWGALQSLARAEYVAPLFSATVIHLVFTSAGLFLLYKQDNQAR